ncbi:Exodeoxyribonuclease VII large subunit [Hathewaya proteolytica DSM 3090]|uniref:Exodeoxyribonuclease 7 large subunit n=1 Tax=Hathewaya proteolytica DSM 3090 TaxID=1121331 RepID=A0A1M6L4L5_9CLOT|nr:exodeoxyribonuclease VII large subunit [Hathewaya proteolytica]SHJ66161.1 Exodeoxyribonuclease VII large subunit [Hathewaya proteolytica DSM 3090]
MIMKVLTVSGLNSYIKKSFDNDVILNNVHVKGEISNFKLHTSGHCYFTIKDNNSRVNCVMFQEYTERLSFLPKEGDNVIIKGRVSVYERDGAYQVYAREIELEGVGKLYYEFNLLKEKLEKEGLFSQEHKKLIPEYPQCVGVITSPTGAAIQDIINVASRRNIGVKLIINPALVQGKDAASSVIKALDELDKRKDVDTIIIARGGGSIEELWPFNNEELAYAIYKCKKPIISGVGHEIDFTICDFVSDMRAPTPSAAAELAIPLRQDMMSRNIIATRELNSTMKDFLEKQKRALNDYKFILLNNSPQNYIVNQYNYVENLTNKISHTMELYLNKENERLSRLKLILNAANPLNVVQKGYAILEDKDKRVISDIEALKNSQFIYVTLKDGRVRVNIEVEDVD